MRHRFLLFGFAGLATVASCGLTLDYDALQTGSRDASAGGNGGAGGAGGAAATGIPLDQLAPAVAQAFCDNVTTCYASALEFIIHDESCVSLFTNIVSEQTVAEIQASVASGAITYDPIGGRECVNRIVEATAKSPPSCVNIEAVIEDCKSMLGSLATKDAGCSNLYECATGLRCKLEACPGTCTTYGDVAALCAQNSDCDPTKDLYCQPGAGDTDAGAGGAGGAGAQTGTCQKRTAMGAACSDRQECVAGAFCIGGTCKPIKDAFTSAETFDCYGNGVLCQPGLSCEFPALPLIGNGTCAKEKSLAGACRFSFPDECPKGAYCNVTALRLNGQCVAAPSENQPCASDLEQALGVAAPCAAGLVCVNGLCKPYKHLSEACEASPQCYSGACFPPPEGGATACVLASCP